MTIKELVQKLSEYDQNLNVSLDTSGGVEFLEIDQVYKNQNGLVLYGSIFSVDQTSSEF